MADEKRLKKITGQSMDIEALEKEKLRAVFPQCFNEGRLDIDKLLSLCGEYIDNDFEKYKFEWKGKSECYRIAGKRSSGTLRPCPEESVEFEQTKNLYIEGDNLEVLKLLQTAYYRKVKMIYIDPPYNTGNDFVYEDDFKDPLARYKAITSQTTKSNPETMGRYHTNWLNMMFPRLRLAANLLRDDGVIFISIDDNEVTNLRRICDDVFGEENFVEMFSWIKTSTPPGLSMKSRKTVEYILVYEKHRSNIKYKGELLDGGDQPLLNTGNTLRSLSFPKDKVVFKIPDGKYKAGNYERIRLLQDIEIVNSYSKTDFALEGEFKWTQSTLDDEINKNTIFIVKSEKFAIRFIREDKEGYKAPTNLIKEKYVSPLINKKENNVDTNETASSELEILLGGKYFEFSKPVTLIKHLLGFMTSNNDIILDFFSGSATTAHAVMQLNAEDGGQRQFIMVQLPEITDEKSEAYKAGYKNICEIGKERIRRAGAKIKQQNPQVDTGFKVLKLDSSNLVKWDDRPLDSEDTGSLFTRLDQMEKSLKKDRQDLDIVFEVMLKLGIPPTYEIKSIKVNQRQVYSIGEDGLVLICLDSTDGGITPEDVKAMCDLTPAKIIAAEEAFADDVALSNAYYISKDSGVEIELL